MDDNSLQWMIGARIAYLRRLHRWDQERLAKETGLSRSYISKIETGECGLGISIETYMLIADALDIPLWKLVKVEED